MTLDKLVIDDYEARFREYEDKVNTLAADLLEERAQRREVGEALVRVTEERDQFQKKLTDEQGSHAMTQSSFEIFVESMTEDRDGWKAAVERVTERGIQHARRHQALFDEWLHERAQLIDDRDELAKTLEFEREHHRGVREYAVARQAERDEARDEVVRLGRENAGLTDDNWALTMRVVEQGAELARLRTIIGELGAAEAAEPQEEIEALRPEDRCTNCIRGCLPGPTCPAVGPS